MPFIHISKLFTQFFLAIAIFISFSNSHAMTLKIATLAPDGTTWMKEMRAAGREINEKTAGRVKLKFYPGGVMGNDKSMIKKIRLGQLQGGAMTGGSLASIYPDMQIYSLPMVFKNYSEIDYVRPVIDPLLKKGMKKKGFTILGISEGGFAYLMSNSTLKDVADLKKHKLWIPEDDVLNEALFRKMGVHPVTLSLADVYTGLQTGLIDTIGSTTTGALAFQWHTRIRSITDVPLVYLIGVLIVDNKHFNKINAADQKIIKDIITKSFSALDKVNRKDNENARQALQKMGTEFAKPDDSEIAYWSRLADEVIEETGSRAASPELYQQLKDLLKEYRSGMDSSAVR
ncbi:MAG: TRAP transporter substrate-binding protein [Gammaproteobacteria bacterium]|nr:MAG: TRAP transporter substrate-binding protein [Gammaproteobacteria bacterium]